MFDFAEQVIVATGGAGNLGATLARAGHRAGGRVAGPAYGRGYS